MPRDAARTADTEEEEQPQMELHYSSDLLDEDRSGRVQSHFSVKKFLPRRVGEQIAKRYDIDDHEIGVGGNGKVFVAMDRNPRMKGRLVAIKKLICRDEDKKRAFQNEVSVMLELDHPNICKLLETYDEGRYLFLVMEYLDGGELMDRIENSDEGSLPEPLAADIVRQVAGALLHAHRSGIAHRDMKPENICFCTREAEDNRVKVIDWGLGFYFGISKMKTSVGTEAYAAPEVLEACEEGNYTCACDLWSLGVLAYFMLCGRAPFSGGVLQQVSSMRQEAFRQDGTWLSISGPGQDLIRGLLRAKPEDRMPIDRVLEHSWLQLRPELDAKIGREVLSSVRTWHHASPFWTFCVALGARQLDHRSLRDVHRIFCEMDTNGDGALEPKELKAGFERIFGQGSEQVRDVDELFSRLDLDGSGKIDYTEFCAAGIGERLDKEDDLLWAAFNAFDIQDSENGEVTKHEIKAVLQKADCHRLLTDDICDELSDELFSRFDGNGDGSLDFQEWVSLMREISRRHHHTDGMHRGRFVSDKRLDEVERATSSQRFDKAYSVLAGTSRPSFREGSAANAADGGSAPPVRPPPQPVAAEPPPGRRKAEAVGCCACSGLGAAETCAVM